MATAMSPDIAYRGRKRSVPMQVLALGMSRSGTETLCRALEILGYPTYHGWRTFEHVSHSSLWWEALQAKYENKGEPWTREDFDAILGDFAATTDFPAGIFAVELTQAYPEAKVILNKRPFKLWWASWEKTLMALYQNRMLKVLSLFDTELRTFCGMWRTAFTHFFRGDPRRNAASTYDHHCALVRGTVPPDRFLQWEPSQGWEPLCKFLGKPIPNEEFPSTNVATQFHQKVDMYFAWGMQRAKRNAAIASAALIGVVSYVWYHNHT